MASINSWVSGLESSSKQPNLTSKATLAIAARKIQFYFYSRTVAVYLHSSDHLVSSFKKLSGTSSFALRILRILQNEI